jgi:hypothetical protein
MYITPDDGDERLNCIDAPYSSIGNVIWRGYVLSSSSYFSASTPFE